MGIRASHAGPQGPGRDSSRRPHKSSRHVDTFWAFQCHLAAQMQARTELACTPRAQGQLSAAPGIKYAVLCCKNKLVVSSREPAKQRVPVSDPKPHTTALKTGPDRAGDVGSRMWWGLRGASLVPSGSPGNPPLVSESCGKSSLSLWFGADDQAPCSHPDLPVLQDHPCCRVSAPKGGATGSPGPSM